MLPNGELHVLSVRQGDENHLYHCRLLVKPNGSTLTSSTAGRILLLSGTLLLSNQLALSWDASTTWNYLYIYV